MTPKVDLEELVTAADIARRLKVSPQRVRVLAGRDDFPDPLGRVGNYVIYRWADIQRWAQKTGRPLTPS